MKRIGYLVCALALTSLGCETESTQEAGAGYSYGIGTVLFNNRTSFDWPNTWIYVDNNSDRTAWFYQSQYTTVTHAGTGWVKFEGVAIPDGYHEDYGSFDDPAMNKWSITLDLTAGGDNIVDVFDNGTFQQSYASWAPPVSTTPPPSTTPPSGSCGSNCVSNCSSGQQACYYCYAACVSNACGDAAGAAADMDAANSLGGCS